MSYLTQMLGLTVQNFVSAATGMAVVIALIRGIARHSANGIGQLLGGPDTFDACTSFCRFRWLWLLALVSQGVVQTIGSLQDRRAASAHDNANAGAVTEQVLALGPAASQIAIKQLGTNGGGFFNVNSSHPFENPTPFSNLVGDALDPGDLRGALLHVRQDGGRYPAGLGAAGDDDPDLHRLPGARRMVGARRQPGLCGDGRGPDAEQHQSGREHGRQGNALRYRQFSPVGDGYNGGLERVGELDARFIHATGRTGTAVHDAAGRNHLRRRRLRVVRHAGLRDRGGLHCGPDGGAHARVPGQEDRSLRDEDGLA